MFKRPKTIHDIKVGSIWTYEDAPGRYTRYPDRTVWKYVVTKIDVDAKVIYFKERGNEYVQQMTYGEFRGSMYGVPAAKDVSRLRLMSLLYQALRSGLFKEDLFNTLYELEI